MEKMTKLLGELLIDSKRSDRELAQILGVSQPTVSRMKKNLVDNETISSYSVIPNFRKIGYKIMALTFVETNTSYSTKEDWNKMARDVRTWMQKKPNVIFADRCRGLGMTGGMISFHRSYDDFDVFIANHNRELGKYLKNVKNVLFNLGDHEKIKPFHFKYLVDDL